MRKLLNTLYVTGTDRYLSLDGENVVISSEGKELKRIAFHNIEGIVSFGYAGASPALMGACAKRNISLSFMTANNRFLARISGEVHGNVILRKEQYRLSEKKEEAIKVARNCIIGKVYNSKLILERAIRDYPLRIDTEKLKSKVILLTERLSQIRKCEDASILLGLEGEAASEYFSVLDELILQQKETFYFYGRNRRPPLDPVNSMLSFAYYQ